MERTLLRAWTHRGWLALLLWPLSLLYRFLWILRRWLYRTGVLRSVQVSVPVVVVGNVIAGGAGKTPVVIAVAKHLVARGWSPGIVSRGYGRTSTSVQEVSNASCATDVGDEALLLRQRTGLPVCVGNRRAEAAQRLLQRHPRVNIVLCDDGLQHLGLRRDIEICVFDERGTGNGWLLPAGPLREPWPRSVELVLAPATVELGCPTYAVARTLASHGQRADGTRVALESLRHSRILAVAGIAQPERFFDMLRAAGLELARCVALPDHHAYTPEDLAPGPDEQVVCTEKDAVKLWTWWPAALAIPLHLDIAADFLQALDTQLERLRTSVGANPWQTREL